MAVWSATADPCPAGGDPTPGGMACLEKGKVAAKRIEKKYGVKNLLFNDFEWGMINGKLSALRWVLGDEWDMLDT